MRHKEQHFSGSDTVRDVVIGMADGLTVPFALTATPKIAGDHGHDGLRQTTVEIVALKNQCRTSLGGAKV